MDDSVFILVAYGISGALIAALCLASWLRARAVNRQLENTPDA